MSSKFGTLKRVILLGFRNFWRNRWLTLGATLLMTLTLTMISVSILTSFAIRDATEVVRDKINLSIYFRDDQVSEEKIIALKTRISLLPTVESVEYIDKLRALEIFRRLPLNENIIAPINETNNPLPRSLEVSTNEVDNLTFLRDEIVKVDTDRLICDECVSLTHNREIIDQVLRGTRVVQNIGWLLSIFFGLIAVFNVSNIIRITISARSDEIEIMRYVGASNAFTRGPFVIEGLLYGILGTVLATIALPSLLLLLKAFDAGQEISGAFRLLGSDSLEYLKLNLPEIVAIQLTIGVILGTVVSFISIRRYLKA